MLLDPTNPEIWHEAEPVTDFITLLIETFNCAAGLRLPSLVLRLQLTKTDLEATLLAIRAMKTEHTVDTPRSAPSGRPGHSFEATVEATVHHSHYPTKSCRSLRWNVAGDSVWLSDENYVLPWKPAEYQHSFQYQNPFRSILQSVVFRTPELGHALRLNNRKPYTIHLSRRFPAFAKKLHLLGTES